MREALATVAKRIDRVWLSVQWTSVTSSLSCASTGDCAQYKQAMATVHHERSQATKQRKRQGQQRSELCSPLHLVGVFDIGPRGGTVPG